MSYLALGEQERAKAYIEARVIVDPKSGCWVWQMSTSDGYGQMRWGEDIWRVHRFVFHYLVAYLPKAAIVHHACSQRACCNPDHLAAVSHHDNVAEMLGRRFYEEELEHLRDVIDQLQEEIRQLKERAS